MLVLKIDPSSNDKCSSSQISHEMLAYVMQSSRMPNKTMSKFRKLECHAGSMTKSDAVKNSNATVVALHLATCAEVT